MQKILSSLLLLVFFVSSSFLLSACDLSKQETQEFKEQEEGLLQEEKSREISIRPRDNAIYLGKMDGIDVLYYRKTDSREKIYSLYNGLLLDTDGRGKTGYMLLDERRELILLERESLDNNEILANFKIQGNNIYLSIIKRWVSGKIVNGYVEGGEQSSLVAYDMSNSQIIDTIDFGDNSYVLSAVHDNLVLLAKPDYYYSECIVSCGYDDMFVFNRENSEFTKLGNVGDIVFSGDVVIYRKYKMKYEACEESHPLICDGGTRQVYELSGSLIKQELY